MRATKFAASPGLRCLKPAALRPDGPSCDALCFAGAPGRGYLR
jgi:hypothetical protein